MTSAWGLDRTATGVVVRGELDLATAEKFASAVRGMVENLARGPFSVNLSGVTFIDSSGVHALMKLVKEHGETEFVIQTSPPVFAVLELGGLTGRALPNTIVVPPPDDEPA
jgi:anti-anti-sigma factor